MGKNTDDYSLEEYNHLIQIVYPKEFCFRETTTIEEIQQIDSSIEKKNFIIKELKRLKLLEKRIDRCSITEKIWLQIFSAILKSEEIIVIDNLDYYMEEKDLEEIYSFIKKCIKNFKNSFIMTTTSLENSLDTDLLYIIQSGEFVLHGEPITVLQKDNIINKAGLNIPFMIDLSVKLRDYDLIKEIELNKERLIDVLWN